MRARGGGYLVMSGDLSGSILQVCFRDDVVALEHRAGLVSANLHRDAFRDASPNHVPHCGPAEIVKQPARNAGQSAGCPPRGCEPENPFPVSVKDPRDDDALFSLEFTR